MVVVRDMLEHRGGKLHLVHRWVCAEDGKALLPEQSGQRKARRSSTDDGDVNCGDSAVSIISQPRLQCRSWADIDPFSSAYSARGRIQEARTCANEEQQGLIVAF